MEFAFSLQDVIRWTWLLASLGNMFFGGVNLINVIADLHALNILKIDHSREIVAIASMRIQTYTMLMSTLFVIAGIVAIFSPVSPTSSPLLGGMLVVANLLLLATNLTTFRLRLKLRQYREDTTLKGQVENLTDEHIKENS